MNAPDKSAPERDVALGASGPGADLGTLRSEHPSDLGALAAAPAPTAAVRAAVKEAREVRAHLAEQTRHARELDQQLGTLREALAGAERAALEAAVREQELIAALWAECSDRAAAEVALEQGAAVAHEQRLQAERLANDLRAGQEQTALDVAAVAELRRRLSEMEASLEVERARAAQLAPPPAEIQPASEVASPAGPRGADPEERSREPWPLFSEPDADTTKFGLYDVRPDDPVLREARRGDAFLNGLDLMTIAPRFAEGVSVLNATAPVGAIVEMDSEATPDVSVVIPVYGQLAYTLNCLDSLFHHPSRYSFEIIVGDDASPDATGVHLPELKRIRHLRWTENGGFIENCNRAAEVARGRFIVLLNNDTRVVDGWLDELIGTLEARPAAGVVGSKFFYPDGWLQEAGGIVWRDGSAWNYGRGDDPSRPRYCYARQVDYASGASIALSLEFWRELGGFNPEYRPAYCEDSDLFFRVRAAGRQTWFQPLSRVIHYEGKTSGTDVGQGAKAYQVVNQVKLLKRWRATLADHRSNGVEPWLERDRGVRGRALVIDATTPTPDQDAGSVTAVKIIGVLQEMGYKVVFAPEDNFLYQRRYSEALQRSGVECLYLPFEKGLETHLSAHGPDYDVVHVFRFEVLERTTGLIRKYCPQARLVFNNMDLHYLRLQRQAIIESSSELLSQAAALKPRELAAMSESDVVCVPSVFEERLLRSEGLPRPVITMPYMVDLVPPRLEFEARRDVVFLGGYAHQPNIDAALWLVQDIWPRIAERRPDARLVIAGANPPEAIKQLASDRVLVPGRVDELSTVFEPCRVFVAPLRYGAGVKGKIYVALAHGLPVVSTTMGVEGMELPDDSFCLVADEPADFTEHVLAAYTDAERWHQMSRDGFQFIAQRHVSAAGVRVMEHALALAVGQARRPKMLSRTDVEALYRLALGREPASEVIVSRCLALDSVGLVRAVFSGPEFAERVVEPLMAGDAAVSRLLTLPPGRGLAEWAADFLPLTAQVRPAVRDSGSLEVLLYSLFGDPAFREAVLSKDTAAANLGFLNALAHQIARHASRTVVSSTELAQLQARYDEVERQLANALAEAYAARQEAREALGARDAILSSTSWRITRPIRILKGGTT